MSDEAIIDDRLYEIQQEEHDRMWFYECNDCCARWEQSEQIPWDELTCPECYSNDVLETEEE